jgi:hypothetical protein
MVYSIYITSKVHILPYKYKFLWSKCGHEGDDKMKTKRSKACDITDKVKKKVFARDNGMCVVCGNSYNVMPNAHYIPRSKGGLGIEQNVVTMCTNLTENKCHYKYDFGTKEEQECIKLKIEEHLKSKYKNWNKEMLKYSKTCNN